MFNTEHLQEMYNQTFNAWNIVLMLASWVVLRVTRQLLPEIFAKQPKDASLLRKLPRRLMPLYPILICTFFYLFIPGPWIDATLSLGQKALLGVLCGYIAGHSHAIIVRMLPDSVRPLLEEGAKHAEKSSPEKSQDKDCQS